MGLIFLHQASLQPTLLARMTATERHGHTQGWTKHSPGASPSAPPEPGLPACHCLPSPCVPTSRPPAPWLGDRVLSTLGCSCRLCPVCVCVYTRVCMCGTLSRQHNGRAKCKTLPFWLGGINCLQRALQLEHARRRRVALLRANKGSG